MTANRVAMVHPDTKARIDAPETAVKVYERSGWTVAKEDKAETSTTEGSPETGEAGPTRPAARKTKEDGK